MAESFRGRPLPVALAPEGEDALAPVLRRAIPYRIRLGPRRGRKAFTLRALAPDPARQARAATPGPGAPHRGRAPWGDERQAQRLGRVFRIDIETCTACGGAVRVIVSPEDPVLIEKNLAHVGESQTPMPSPLVLRPEPRAPLGLAG
jgi:hypothetical protein